MTLTDKLLRFIHIYIIATFSEMLKHSSIRIKTNYSYACITQSTVGYTVSIRYTRVDWYEYWATTVLRYELDSNVTRVCTKLIIISVELML